MNKKRKHVLAIGLFTMAGILTMNQESVAQFDWDNDGNAASLGDFIGTTNNEPMIIRANTAEMHLTTASRLGLGTAAPDQILHLHENSTAGSIIHFTNANTGATGAVGAYVGYNGLDEVRITNRSEDDIVLSAGTLGEIVRVKPDGKVGIGTASPEDALQVGDAHKKLAVGSAYDSDLEYGTSYLGFNAARSGTGWNTYGDAANNGGAVIYGTIHGDISFIPVPTTGGSGQTNISDNNLLANRAMEIRAGGEVVIGTSSNFSNCTDCSDYKLFVTEGIRTEKVKVDLASANDWADDVFEDDYALQSLEEVDQYIASNGHLPNVPSAKEVEEHGVDLAKMDATLLRKIEELTLYILDQNKMIQELQNEVNELKEK